MKIKRFVTGIIGANTYLAWDENSGEGFIVDPGDYSRGLVDSANKESVEIKYIILTHGHGDHIGGVEAFKRVFPAAKTVAYKDEREMFENPDLNSSVEICGRPVTVDIDMYVTEADKLMVGEETLEFLHTPGHTKGGMSITFEGGVFTGDTLFRASIGRTDFYGGSYPEIEKSIRNKLYKLPDWTKVYPGHMEESTIKYEKRNNLFVRN